MSICAECNIHQGDCEHYGGDCAVCSEALCAEIEDEYRTVQLDGEDVHCDCKEKELKKIHKQHSLDLAPKLWRGAAGSDDYFKLSVMKLPVETVFQLLSNN